MYEFKYTGKYYIPTPKDQLNKRIAEEQKHIEYYQKRLLKYKSETAKNVMRASIEVSLREIAYLQEDHFAKRKAIEIEYMEYLKNKGD